MPLNFVEMRLWLISHLDHLLFVYEVLSMVQLHFTCPTSYTLLPGPSGQLIGPQSEASNLDLNSEETVGSQHSPHIQTCPFSTEFLKLDLKCIFSLSNLVLYICLPQLYMFSTYWHFIIFT